MKQLLSGLLILLGTLAYGQCEDKLSPTSRYHWQKTTATANDLQVLVSICDTNVQQKINGQGGRIGTRAGNIWTVTASKKNLAVIACFPEIEQMEISGYTRIKARPDDISNQAMWVDKLQQQPGAGIQIPYNGKNVIVGVVDIGFQPDHATFFDTSGNRYRLLRYWDQQHDGNPPSGFGYGTEYSTENTILSQSDPAATHGTHVMGIAGGSGYGSANRKYAGVAYDADLACVNIRYSNDTLTEGAAGDYLVANPAIIDAYAYLFDYAQSVGKPVVINLSWGMHTGPHDGTSLFDQAVDNLTGQGKIVVGANGNDGSGYIHISHTFSNDTVYSIAVDEGRAFTPSESIYIDAWGEKDKHFQVQVNLVDSMGNFEARSPFIPALLDKDTQVYLVAGTDSLLATFFCQAAYSGNNQPNILLILDNKVPVKHAVAIGITQSGGTFHAWNSGNAYRYSRGFFFSSIYGNPAPPKFISGNHQYTMGENGGTGKNTISVGAIVALDQWKNINGDDVHTGGIPGEIAGFSSRGPTVDGRIKPDISAPGVDVISAYNRYAQDTNNLSRVASKTTFRGHTDYYGAASGTSMAAPQVTGVVALLLQANPALTPADIRSILQASAIQDDQTGITPNNTYGWGKINAYAAVLLAQAPLGTAPVSSKENLLVYPNPASGNISVANIDGKMSFRLYDLAGKLLLQGTSEDNRIDVSGVKKGVFILKITGEGHNYNGKVVLY